MSSWLHRELSFNGIDGRTGRPRWRAMALAELARHLCLETPPPHHRAPLAHLDDGDLAEVGWGVVFPADLDPSIREALSPLIEHRRGQTHGRFRDDLVYYGGGSWRFIDDHSGPGPADPTDLPGDGLPYYLLLVGSPEQLPYELQMGLSTSHAVGRLDLDSAEHHAAYVRGVLDVERGSIHRPPKLDFFGTEHEGDTNTVLCQSHLFAPSKARLADLDEPWTIEHHPPELAHKERLTRLLGGVETPSLLLTANHGVLFHDTDPLFASDQGALLCADWPGPRLWGDRGRIPPELYLAPRDIPDSADVRGLVTLHIACFSAGTPRLDAFSRAWQGAIPSHASRPMGAGLPKRLLGHPGGGALAVIGHVDQAFTEAFCWTGGKARVGPFEAFFRALVAGRPVGAALSGLMERRTELGTRLTDLREAKREGRWRSSIEGLNAAEEEAFLWLAYHDAKGYALLGDPAVRLGPPRRRPCESGP